LHCYVYSGRSYAFLAAVFLCCLPFLHGIFAVVVQECGGGVASGASVAFTLHPLHMKLLGIFIAGVAGGDPCAHRVVRNRSEVFADHKSRRVHTDGGGRARSSCQKRAYRNERNAAACRFRIDFFGRRKYSGKIYRRVFSEKSVRNFFNRACAISGA